MYYLSDVGSSTTNQESVIFRFTLNLQSVVELSLRGERGAGWRGEGEEREERESEER